MIRLAFPIIPIVFTSILTCELESHVIFIHSGLEVRTSSQLRLKRYKRREWTSLFSIRTVPSHLSNHTPHTLSHQWISSLTSSPSPPTPPRPSPPHPIPLMQLEAAVAALLRRWSPFLTVVARYSPNANQTTFGKRSGLNVPCFPS